MQAPFWALGPQAAVMTWRRTINRCTLHLHQHFQQDALWTVPVKPRAGEYSMYTLHMPVMPVTAGAGILRMCKCLFEHA